MKLLVALCVLALVALSSADPPGYPRGCIYVEGRCVEGCEVGTHDYTTGCSPVTPEATCDEPNPKPEDWDTCDFTACYCDPPTVRDKVSNKCVTLDQCPKKNVQEKSPQ